MHLFYPDAVAVVAITGRAGGYIEFEAVVNRIGVGFADVPPHPTGPEHGAAGRDIYRHFPGKDTDALGARQQYLVLFEQSLVLVNPARHFLEELLQGGDKLFGEVLADAAHPHIVVGQALAADHVEEVQNLLSFPNHIEHGGHKGAAVVEESADGDKVAGEALQLSHNHPDVFRPLRHRNTSQLFHRQAVSQVVAHRGQIVEPVGEGDAAAVGALLGQFFDAAVEIAEDGFHIDDDLAVERGAHAEDPVGAGVGGADIEHEGLGLDGYLFSRHRKSFLKGWPSKPSQRTIRLRLGWPSKPMPSRSKISLS
ncbi:hypothetical protein ES703_112234 [subsurface metagenome]